MWLSRSRQGTVQHQPGPRYQDALLLEDPPNDGRHSAHQTNLRISKASYSAVKKFLRNFLRSFSKFSRLFRGFQTCSDPFGSIRTHWDAFGCIGTHSEASGRFRQNSVFFEILNWFSMVSDVPAVARKNEKIKIKIKIKNEK